MQKLMNEYKLVMFNQGKKVYQNDVDKTFVELVTKRYNPKIDYSQRAKEVFRDINNMTNMPKHRSSGKQKIMTGGHTTILYTNPQDLVNRLKVISGSLNAGNSSIALKNEAYEVIDHLRTIGAMSYSQYEKFVEKYLES